MPDSIQLKKIRKKFYEQSPFCRYCGCSLVLNSYENIPKKLVLQMATIDHLYEKWHPARRLYNGEQRYILSCNRCNNHRAIWRDFTKNEILTEYFGQIPQWKRELENILDGAWKKLDKIAGYDRINFYFQGIFVSSSRERSIERDHHVWPACVLGSSRLSFSTPRSTVAPPLDIAVIVRFLQRIERWTVPPLSVWGGAWFFHARIFAAGVAQW